MRPSCIDCEEFTHCGKATRAWRRAIRDYPVRDDDGIEARLGVMQTQYSICHEKQMTFQTFKRPERAF